MGPASALKSALHDQFGLQVEIPAQGQSFDLAAL
jgi:hypothetical protein